MALNLGELNAVIDADDRGFNRTINRVHDAMDRTGKKMGGLTGILSGLGKATAFASLATGAAGAASAIGPLLGLVSTLGVALGTLGAAIPAFAVGAAAAIATLKIGFTGLSEAIAGDEEALKKLPPSAREIVSAVKNLAPAWDKVTRSVQEKLWAGIADDFSAIAGKILPRLESGLGGIASAFNTVGKNALDALDSEEVLGGLDKGLEATKDGITAFAAGVKPALEGVGLLIGAFSPLLVDAGEAAASLAQRFRDWIGEAVETGRVDDMIATLKDTLSTLGGIVSNVGSVFSSVFSAASATGGGLLNTIETLTGRLAAFFDSAKGQDALNSFFTALVAVAAAVVPIVIELADAIATDLAPHFADIATEVGPALRDLVRELGDAIGGIDVANLASGLADILVAVASIVGPLGDFIGWLSQVPNIVPIIVGAIIAWTVAQWALNVALTANPIGLVIVAIAALIAIIVLLVTHWDTVVAALGVAWDWIKEKAVAVWDWLTQFFSDWWPLILGVFTGGIGLIVGLITENWNSIEAFFVSVWNAIASFFQSVWNSIVGFVEFHVNAVLNAVAWFNQLPGRVKTWFGNVKDAAVDRLVALVTWVGSLPGRILGKLDSLAGDMLSLGKDIISGLLSGMKNQAGAVLDWVMGLAGDIADQVTDFFGISSPSKLMAGYGENISQGLAGGIASAASAVDAAIAGLTTGVGLEVDGSAGSSVQVSATASLSEEDRALLRELAASTTNLSISTDANTRVAEIKRDVMVVG